MTRNGTGRTSPPPSRETSVVLSDELVTLLRERVATHYYEQPRVVDVLARRLLQLGSS